MPLKWRSEGCFTSHPCSTASKYGCNGRVDGHDDQGLHVYVHRLGTSIVEAFHVGVPDPASACQECSLSV